MNIYFQTLKNLVCLSLLLLIFFYRKYIYIFFKYLYHSILKNKNTIEYHKNYCKINCMHNNISTNLLLPYFKINDLVDINMVINLNNNLQILDLNYINHKLTKKTHIIGLPKKLKFIGASNGIITLTKITNCYIDDNDTNNTIKIIIEDPDINIYNLINEKYKK